MLNFSQRDNTHVITSFSKIKTWPAPAMLLLSHRPSSNNYHHCFFPTKHSLTCVHKFWCQVFIIVQFKIFSNFYSDFFHRFLIFGGCSSFYLVTDFLLNSTGSKNTLMVSIFEMLGDLGSHFMAQDVVSFGKCFTFPY